MRNKGVHLLVKIILVYSIETFTLPRTVFMFFLRFSQQKLKFSL